MLKCIMGIYKHDESSKVFQQKRVKVKLRVNIFDVFYEFKIIIHSGL